MLSQKHGRFILKAASRLGYSQKHLYYRWQRRFGRVVFIHINKCGGTSIEAALGIPKKIHDTALRRREMIGLSDGRNALPFRCATSIRSRVLGLPSPGYDQSERAG